MRFLLRPALIALGLGLDWLAIPPGPLPAAILVADAPFLWLLFHDRGRRWKRWTYLYGVLHFGVALAWLHEVRPEHPFVTAAILGLVYLLLGGAIRLGVRFGAPWLLLVPLGAVFEEMLRTVWFGGMPWPTRSMSFAGSEVLTASSMLFGAYALSFLAALSSAVLAGVPSLVRAGPEDRGRLAARLALAAAFPVALAVFLGYVGFRRTALYEARLARGEVATTRSVVAIQGDIPQSLKRAATQPEPPPSEGGTDPLEDPSNRMFQRHVQLTRRALEDELAAGRDPLAVIWPETMIPWDLVDARVTSEPEWENQVRIVQTLAAATPPGADVHHLVGAIAVLPKEAGASGEAAERVQRDSLFHLRARDLPRPEDPYPPRPGPGGPPWQVGRHDKRVLVPGGEYTPLGDLLPPLRALRNRISVGIPELDPGEADLAPFLLGTVRRAGFEPVEIRAGTVVCFEVVFPASCRSWRLRGAQVLLNPGNYGWFGQTAESQATFRAQLEALVRLRAAETATTVVVAGNRGPTLFFDPLGRAEGRFVAAESGAAVEPIGSAGTTYRQGWAQGVLRIEEVLTPYVRWGDVPWWALGALTAGVAGVTHRRRSRSRGGVESAPPAGVRGPEDAGPAGEMV